MKYKRKNTDLKKNEVKELRPYWLVLSDEYKRKFLIVSKEKFSSFVEHRHGTEGRVALEQVLTYAREKKKWRFWMCRTCSEKFSSPENIESHLRTNHAAEHIPSSTEDIAQMISKVWVLKISIGEWKPVDSAAAAEMIKNPLQDVKIFAYKNGWSQEWPFVEDEERSQLLNEMKSLLVKFCALKILSCSIRDWMMQFPVKHLAQYEVSEQALTSKTRLMDTPQSLCFLECPQLIQILDFLKTIKCERNDGTYLVSRAVNSFLDCTRVKEKIDMDSQFSSLLVDKRLLQSKMMRFDDEGSLSVIDNPSGHYDSVSAHGDGILNWLADYYSEYESFRFPNAIRAHNIDIWVAVLRAVQFTCKTLRIKYAKKRELLRYHAALTDAKNVSISEDERRRKISKEQWNTYASLLCDKCEELVHGDAGNSLRTKVFVCAVLDVLQGASHPTSKVGRQIDCLNLIHEQRHISDDRVLKYIDILSSEVTKKVSLGDSKILLVEKTRKNMLNDLVRLSYFDYRSYILQPLKRFLQGELDDVITDIDAKAKLATENEKKKSGPKKKRYRSNKKTSTSVVKHEQGLTPQAPQALNDDSVEPEEFDEKGQSEVSSNTDNQEGVTKDTQSMSTVHGKAATRYNSALDMIIKSLFNIEVLKEDLVHNQQPFSDNQVPCALRELFSAFVSETIKEEGLYTYLLGNLVASLEEVHSLSSDAAEVVVAILEFCHSWKSPESESLVTRLFTLEVYERMTCTICRRTPIYPKPSSYILVVDANSVRDLRSALETFQFEYILKLIRMEEEVSCDVITGGCGTSNIVHHSIKTCPPIFTIVLEWEKNETGIDILEVTNALEWEIDMSDLYEGLEPNTNYRLVSMVCCGEEGKYICMAYKQNRWVSLKHEEEALAEEDVGGDWKSVASFCGERTIRPDILFYEACQWPNK